MTTTCPLDVVDVRLAAALYHRPFLILVSAEYHDQVHTRAEALRIGEAAAKGGARVIVVKVSGPPEAWRLIRRWNGATYASVGS